MLIYRNGMERTDEDGGVRENREVNSNEKYFGGSWDAEFRRIHGKRWKGVVRTRESEREGDACFLQEVAASIRAGLADMRSAVTRTVSVIQLNQHNNVNSTTEHTCNVTNSLAQNMFTNYNSSLL
jgi:hypothetical protein